MTTNEIRDELKLTKRRFLATARRHQDARDSAVATVVKALRSGMAPTEVTRNSPFSDTYVRQLARAHGIGPARPGIKRKHTEGA